MPRPYAGAFPVLPTTFDEAGNLDSESQLRAVDHFLASGVDGFTILANYSEQFSLSDPERETLTRSILQHTAGRVPVIVTTTHYSTRIAAERSRQAQDLGAAMVMLMPPFHGTIRAEASESFEFFKAVSEAIEIPIMIQDASVSGVTLSASFLARLANEIPNVKYFKIEVPGTTVKIRELLRLAGPSIEGAFDGEEAITLIHDLAAGATGTIPGGMVPGVLGEVVRRYRAGQVAEATALYERILPLLNYENKVCGLRATKAFLKEAGVIRCEACRSPYPTYLPPEVRAGLVDLARRLNLLGG